jgi:hypothetical protein
MLQVGTAADARINGINLKTIGATLLDMKAWFCGLKYFCGNVSYSSLPIFSAHHAPGHGLHRY